MPKALDSSLSAAKSKSRNKMLYSALSVRLLSFPLQFHPHSPKRFYFVKQKWKQEDQNKKLRLWTVCNVFRDIVTTQLRLDTHTDIMQCSIIVY
jgi:hypothetical protein